MTGKPIVINGNVENRGHIDNLPRGHLRRGAVPGRPQRRAADQRRPLPPQLAALMQTNINVQELTVEAIVTGRMEHAKHAAMLDPHTAAELSLEEISDLVDDLLRGTWRVGAGRRHPERGLMPLERKRRVALVGTGHRGAGTWGKELLANCGEWVELVGLCDANSLRSSARRAAIGTDAPVFTDRAEMLAATRPDTLIVCTAATTPMPT